MRVLTEYEVGRCFSAIEAVMLLNKPIAEVMTRSAKLEELKADLKACLDLVGNKGHGIKFWIRKSGCHYRYGFYKEPWALRALGFLDRAKIDDFDREWISGLLFGYAPQEIQKFISSAPKRVVKKATKR